MKRYSTFIRWTKDEPYIDAEESPCGEWVCAQDATKLREEAFREAAIKVMGFAVSDCRTDVNKMELASKISMLLLAEVEVHL